MFGFFPSGYLTTIFVGLSKRDGTPIPGHGKLFKKKYPCFQWVKNGEMRSGRWFQKRAKLHSPADNSLMDLDQVVYLRHRLSGNLVCSIVTLWGRGVGERKTWNRQFFIERWQPCFSLIFSCLAVCAFWWLDKTKASVGLSAFVIEWYPSWSGLDLFL